MSLATSPSSARLARRTSPLSLVRRAQVPPGTGFGLTPLPTSRLVVRPDDDMATLHASLERVANRHLTLAVPPEARALRTPLHYRVLRRFAEELGLTLVIATDEPERRRIAREFGFDVQRLPRVRHWRRPRLTRVASVVSTLGMLALAAVGLPRTQVTLSPHAAPLTQNATITVDLRSGAPGVASGWAAGKTQAVTFEVEQTVPTTGKQAIGHTPATGYVTFNDMRVYMPPPPPIAALPPTTAAPPATAAQPPTLGAQLGGLAPSAVPIQIPLPEVRRPEPPPERVIPAGTAVLTQDGKRFFTQAEARLAPSSYASISIVAEWPGRVGNVPTGAIDRIEDGQPVDTHDLRITNRLPTYGGTDRQEAVVASDDRERLAKALDERAAAEAPARLFAEAGTDQMLIPETTTWTVETLYDYAPGLRASQLQARAVVRAQAISIPQRAADELATRQWREALPSDLIGLGTPQLAGAPTLQERADDHLVVSLPVQGKVTPQFDPGALAERLRGQPVDAVRAQVASLPGLRDAARVDVWPAWAPATLRVDVVVAATR